MYKRQGKYDTDITETFTPPAPGEWVPGVEVEKKVTVTNKGDVKLAALATVNQVWVRTENVIDTDDEKEGEPIPPKAGEYFDLMFQNGDAMEYASIVSWGSEVVALESVKDAAAGMRITATVSGLDDTAAAGKWVMVNAVNTKDTDGKETKMCIRDSGGTVGPALPHSRIRTVFPNRDGAGQRPAGCLLYTS